MITDIFDTERQQDRQNTVKNLAYAVESFVIDYFDRDDADGRKLNFYAMSRMRSGFFDSESLFDYERYVVTTKVRPILLGLGIPESVKGFRLLSLVILGCVNLSLDGKGYKMNEVYLDASEKAGISKTRCERLCRYAVTFAKASYDFVAKYPSLSELTHRTVEGITVKELCDIITWYLIRECKIRF